MGGADEHRRHRRHQPARDDDRLGARHRPARGPRHRLAEPDHRALLRAAPRGGSRAVRPRAHRAAAGRLLLRPEDPAHPRGGRPARRGRSGASWRSAPWTRWLVWRLTGGRIHATDVSNASRTLLLDLRTLDWDDDLLRLMEVPRAMLPEVRPSSAVWGETDAAIFGRPIPIAGVAGDQQAAMFGQACFEPGEAKNTYGTGAFLLANVGAAPVASATACCRRSCGGWARVGRSPTRSRAPCSSPAPPSSGCGTGCGRSARRRGSRSSTRGVEDTGGVYLVPAFVGLGAPYWDPHARGLLIGLTRGTGLPEIARATIESIAYQVRGRGRGDGGGPGRAAGGPAGGRGRGAQRRAAAVPGGPAGRRRWSGRASRRRRPGARPRWPASRRACGVRWRSWPRSGRWTGGSSPSMVRGAPRDAAAGLAPRGRAVQGLGDGLTQYLPRKFGYRHGAACLVDCARARIAAHAHTPFARSTLGLLRHALEDPGKRRRQLEEIGTWPTRP